MGFFFARPFHKQADPPQASPLCALCALNFVPSVLNSDSGIFPRLIALASAFSSSALWCSARKVKALAA